MKLKVLFLIIIIVLAVAAVGTYWVWEKKGEEVPMPIVQEPRNGTPNTNTDEEVIEPRINPETGWKIFEHPDVPITFEYPGEFSYKGMNLNEGQGFTAIGFENDQLNLTLVFSAEGKGLENIQIKTFGHASFYIHERGFTVPLLEYDDVTPVFVMLSNQAVPPLEDYDTSITPFRVQLRCRTQSCSRASAQDILQRITLSISRTIPARK